MSSAPRQALARVFPPSQRVQQSQDFNKNLSLRRIGCGVRAKHAGVEATWLTAGNEPSQPNPPQVQQRKSF